MAESDKTLSLLVKLGVIGKDDVDAANQLLKETGTQTHGLADATAELGKKTVPAADAVEKLGGHSLELHRVASLLNRVLPGSGEAVRALEHSGSGTALAFIGMATAIEMVISAIEKLKASAKAADESLAQSLTEGGSLDAINKQKKAWEDADLAQEKYFHHGEVKNVFKAQEESKTAMGNLAKHEGRMETYGGNIASATAALKASGVTAEDEQAIRQAYEAISGKPAYGPGALDLGAQADYVRNHIYTTSAVPLSEGLSIANMFSLAVGGRGLNDANFAAYDLAKNDIRRNQGGLKSESSKDYSIRLAAQTAEENLKASQDALDKTPRAGFFTGPEPGSGGGGALPYRLTAQGRARFSSDQLEGAYDVLKHGGTLNDRQAQLIQSILGVVEGHKVQTDKIMGILETVLGNQKSRDAAFDRLKVSFEQRAIN